MTEPTRIPPQQLEAERAVLGLMLLDAAAATTVLSSLEADDFYLEAHRVVFRVARRVADAGARVDTITLNAALNANAEDLQLSGGPARLALLVEQASVEVYLDEYIILVRAAAAQRRQIQALTRAIDMAWNGVPPGKLAVDVSETLVQIAELVESGHIRRRFGPQPLQEVLDALLLDMDEPEGDYVPSPIPELNDRLGGGVLRTEMVTLGGRPGVAKSALAVQWALLAANKGHRTIVFSREMTNAALGRRVLSQHARVAALALRKRDLSPEERARIVRHLPRLGALPIWFDDVSASIGRIRQVVRAGGYRFVVVDYLQLVRSPNMKDRRLEVSAVSAGLKDLAKRFECSVLALSSLSRLSKYGGKNAAPDMDALKESGDLEHDADIVLLLHQPDKESPDRELIFEKLREGASGGIVTLNFQSQYVTFDEVPAADEPGAGDVPF